MPEVLLLNEPLPEASGFPSMRMTVERYHRLVASGFLTEDDNVELLEGLIVPKMPKNPPHRFATRFLDRWFSKRVPDGWDVQNQEPITLSESEPEPDLAVVRGSDADFAARHPASTEVGLVIEIADTSLLGDRRKGRIYARDRLPEYWIVNLSERSIEVYRRPEGAGDQARYAELVIYREADTIPVTLAGASLGPLAVRELLPQA